MPFFPPPRGNSKTYVSWPFRFPYQSREYPPVTHKNQTRSYHNPQPPPRTFWLTIHPFNTQPHPSCSRKSTCLSIYSPPRHPFFRRPQAPSTNKQTNASSISPGAKSKVKSSVQRAIRQKVVETYPRLAPHIDEIIPKKSQLDLVKL